MAAPEEELRMPFWSHLEELRKRLVRSLILIAVGFGICFNYSENILRILMWPLNSKMEFKLAYPFVSILPNASPQKLHYTTLVEPFWSHLKIGLIAGIMLVFPFIMFQVWKFIGPGLHVKEKKYIVLFIFFSSLFFGIGVLFCYFVMLPFAVSFLLTYKTENLVAILRIQDYIDFILKFLLASGIVFELPLIIVLLSRMGIVSPATLAKFRKFAFLGAFILGAILSPTPDIFNQTILSIPIYLLYEVGILASRLVGRKKESKSAGTAES
ncbi:MAG TPA: twin-arginine translocase subunit TatC [Nitrospirota bacterium]|nr:twin-arginine translocase subunit TatC [Nitrospirota bacterium]